MSDIGAPDTIQTVLSLINDCFQEAASTMNVGEEHVTVRVMELFRQEDLQGIAKLMEQTKMEKDFLADLQQFIKRWSTRVNTSL